jgi:hypothetical protein
MIDLKTCPAWCPGGAENHVDMFGVLQHKVPIGATDIMPESPGKRSRSVAVQVELIELPTDEPELFTEGEVAETFIWVAIDDEDGVELRSAEARAFALNLLAACDLADLVRA